MEFMCHVVKMTRISAQGGHDISLAAYPLDLPRVVLPKAFHQKISTSSKGWDPSPEEWEQLPHQARPALLCRQHSQETSCGKRRCQGQAAGDHRTICSTYPSTASTQLQRPLHPCNTVQVKSPQEDRHLWVMSRKCKHGESKTAQWNITKAVHLLSIWLQWAKEKELLKHGGKVTPVPLDPPPKEQKRRTAPDQTGPKTSVYPFCSDKCVSTNLDNFKGTKALKSGQRKKFTADPLKLSSLTCIQRNFN